MGALPVPRLTPEQYLELDRNAELKSEFHDGEMFPMVAVSLAHSQIVATMVGALTGRLRRGPCRVSVAPMRIQVSPTQYVYPDVFVLCGEPQYTDGRLDTITNPKVIAEVLSPSTSDYDHGEKFALYRTLPSFNEYLLVSQHQIAVEVYRKQSDRFWVLELVEGQEAVVKLESLGIEFPLSEIYDGITLS